MDVRKELVSLVEPLIEKTAAGNIRWEQLDPTSFIVGTPDGTLVAVYVRGEPALVLYDKNSVELGRITPNDSIDLYDLYEAARAKALKIDETLSRMRKALGL